MNHFLKSLHQFAKIRNFTTMSQTFSSPTKKSAPSSPFSSPTKKSSTSSPFSTPTKQCIPSSPKTPRTPSTLPAFPPTPPPRSPKFTYPSPQKASPPPPSPKRKPYLTISIDGNISSGKSTLVGTLNSLLPSEFAFGVDTIPEPLQKWIDVGGKHNLLDMLYKDTVKNNFLFQHYVQLTRVIDTISASPPPEEGQIGRIRVMERSIQNNRYCFSVLAARQGTLHPAEFSVIAEWYSWLAAHVELPLDLILYLRTDPGVVFERMQARGRSEESTVPLAYLSDLHDTYEDWLVRGKIEEEGGPRTYKVIVIDANKSKSDVAEQCRQKISEFIRETIIERAKKAEAASDDVSEQEKDLDTVEKPAAVDLTRAKDSENGENLDPQSDVVDSPTKKPKLTTC